MRSASRRSPARERWILDVSRARARLVALAESMDSAQLQRAAQPLGPPLWDLGHVAHFAQLWLLVKLGGEPVLDADGARRYDPERYPRDRREAVLEPLEKVLGDLHAVERAATQFLLERADERHPLLVDGWVCRMVASHEEQHTETLLQFAQRAGLTVDLGGRRPPVVAKGLDEAERVEIAPCITSIGLERRGGYDNESPEHGVALDAYAIDRWPVSNGRLIEFVEAGGYRRRELWSTAGWEWNRARALAAPRDWRPDAGGRWWRRHFGVWVPVDEHEPAQLLSLHEAEAIASFAGARLPSEWEWEHAAKLGLLQLAEGGVWEWTSTDFAPYPEFEPWPYPEYSATHFGRGYRVLRGAAWTVGPCLVRPTYRNWDLPARDHLFAGLRLCRGGQG
ncbi:MAG: ergothioneine biosynthesis protein EgtB [Planctomycetaceae bacterium]|nr:ergothioneine biosynthesis protein EgtB [Planctomycetaceae bacterium]